MTEDMKFRKIKFQIPKKAIAQSYTKKHRVSQRISATAAATVN
jgi:hypothetical protein